MINVKTTTGSVISLPENVLNKNMLITGLSGSGKTTAIKKTIKQHIADGQKVIIVDSSQSYHPAEFSEYGNNVIIQQNHLNFNPFTINASEDYITEIETITEIIGDAFSFTSKQRNTLYNTLKKECIDGASMNFNTLCMHLSKTKDEKDKIDEHVQNILSRLIPIADKNIFADDNTDFIDTLLYSNCKAALISFTKYNMSTKMLCTELVLNAICNCVRNSAPLKFPVYIVLDEFQHLSFKDDASLTWILREGRKFGVNVILSTQHITALKPAVLNNLHQCATKMFFKPTDSELLKVAGFIDNSDKKPWVKILQNLGIGEFVITAETNSSKQFRPLIAKISD